MSVPPDPVRGPKPRWSVVNPKGLPPDPLAGLVDTIAMVRVGPPLSCRPFGSSPGSTSVMLLLPDRVPVGDVSNRQKEAVTSPTNMKGSSPPNRVLTADTVPVPSSNTFVPRACPAKPDPPDTPPLPGNPGDPLAPSPPAVPSAPGSPSTGGSDPGLPPWSPPQPPAPAAPTAPSSPASPADPAAPPAPAAPPVTVFRASVELKKSRVPMELKTPPPSAPPPAPPLPPFPPSPASP